VLVAADASLSGLAGCGPADLETLLLSLGYRSTTDAEGAVCFTRRRPRRAPQKAPPQGAAGPESAGADAATGATADTKRRARRPKKNRQPDRGHSPAQAARQEEARRREEKRMADSPFAVLRQLALGGE
jgi:hypothetical protein